MYPNEYRIRRSFVIPLSIDAFLLFFLLLMSFFLKVSHLEWIILTVIFIPVLYVVVESLYRMVKTGDQGIVIRKLFRKKDLRWEDITHLGVVVLRKKVYLLLTTVKGFYILSNAYEKFSALVRDIVDHLDKEKVEEEAGKLIEHPVKNRSDIVMAWFTAIVLVGIITTRLAKLIAS